MTEPYAAPTGPPPPKVPEGWKAVWNDQYKEWFYVNLHTKASTWERPTSPAPRPGDEAAGGAPPSYQAGPNAPTTSDSKKTPLDSNNPYGNTHETDEEMARRLQREEEARTRAAAGGHSPNPMGADRGQSDSYYQNSSQGLQPGYGGQQAVSPGGTTARGSSGGGFFGKLKDKLGGSGSSGYGGARPGQYGGGMMPQQGYGHQPGYGPQPGYGGYPPQGQYGYPQQGYMQQGQYMQQPMRKKPGMGVGGAAALGVGGGLLGGMLLADAFDGHDGGGYDQGGYDGGDGGDMGGDMGGGDF